MESQHKHTNQLIHETSPYLLQHAHNPVNWYPWSEDALQKAKSERKLILVSIGYAACHWCHVMEHESFENEELAEVMNKHYICIKVDREQRPDIDQLYMNAAQILNGQGGWPLNCFTLPDGRPVWAATYIRPNDFKRILAEITEKWHAQPLLFDRTANELKGEIVGLELIKWKAPQSEFSTTLLEELYKKASKNFDKEKGGFQQRMKFPMPSDWQFLLKYAHFKNDAELLTQINLTLTSMANGGIYDQLGGGFARYSTDPEWFAPHFEKMLYDNAQLIHLYCDAWKVTQNPLYKKVVYETMQFIIREMLNSENGFYSSLDADSEGKEGKYYVWSKVEIDKVLERDSPLFCDYYGITSEGNWENENILAVNADVNDLCVKYNLTESDFNIKINISKQKLFQLRQSRIRPETDDKTLTAWNAMMLKASIYAYRTFNENQWLELALKNADFLIQKMLRSDGSLFRSYRNGKAEIDGFLDDYAFLSQAFIELYQATFNENWLQEAKSLIDYVIQHFYDSNSGMFFYTSDKQKVLLTRQTEIFDNVIPSSNSVLAYSLYYLGVLFENEQYIEISKQMTFNVQKLLETYRAFSSNWLSMILLMAQSPKEVVICGENALEYRKMIDKQFITNIILAGSEVASNLPIFANRYKSDKTLVYICQNKVCKAPIDDIGLVVKELLLNKSARF